MTAQDHNRLIGTLFLIFGGCSALLLVPIFLQILAALNGLQNPNADASPEAVQNFQNMLALLFVLIVILGVLSLVGSIIEIVAGYAMLKRRAWAQRAAVLAGIVALINIPVGTILGAYALWFLLSAPGKQFYFAALSAAPIKN